MAFRLNSDQERLLSAASLASRSALAALGRASKMRESRVRSILHTLSERSVIRPFAMINAHALGYTDFCLFFRFEPGKRGSRERFLKFLAESPGVAWVAELAGEYSYSVSMLAATIADVDRFLLACARELRSGIVQKSFAVREQWSLFQYKGASGTPTKAAMLSRLSAAPLQKTDDVDRRILARLAKAPGESASSAARNLGLPAATYSYRLKHLETHEVVLGYPYVIDPNALGLHSYRILVFERSVEPNLRQELFAYAREHPYISAYVHCIGEWDYELNIEVPSPPELAQIIVDLEERFGPRIQALKTLAVLRTSKINLFPF